MTPAVKCLKKAKKKYRIHSYDHDPGLKAYGQEAALALEIPGERVFKTLVVSLDGSRLAVAVVPVSMKLDLKAFAKVMNVKKAAMAEKSLVERTTGYILGGVSPLGQKKILKTVIDASARDFETIYVSGGKRGLQIEMAPQDLADLTRAVFAGIGR